MSDTQSSMNWQPILSDQLVRLQPLQIDDFERLYEVASDPLVWEQHPSKTRYQKPVFEIFFQGAMESKGAFLILENDLKTVVGSSRFYDYDEQANRVNIGYTFIARNYWGKAYNQAIKKLMLEYAFQIVQEVHFHVGAENWRSRKAMEKLGGKLIGEIEVAYHGEVKNKNVVFSITRQDWQKSVS